MIIPSRGTSEFWRRYRALPAEVRALAQKNYRLWSTNAYHPSLHFKSIGRADWSVRVGGHYRAVGKNFPARLFFGNGLVRTRNTTDGFESKQCGLLPRAICEMQIENFHLPVCEIIPKLNGKFPKNMNAHATPGRIVFNKIRKFGWKPRDFTEAV